MGTSRATIRLKCGEATISRPRSIEAGAPVRRLVPDREAAEVSACRRAATTIRRVATEYRLSRMITLTRRDESTEEDRDAIVAEVGLFVKRLRRLIPGVRYLYALELHPGGHGWHVHMLVDRFIPVAAVDEAWGHGFVDIRRPKAGRGARSQLDRSRRVAAYLAKYVAKAGGEGRRLGRHRYERANGMPLTEIEAEGDFADIVRLVYEYLGGRVSWLWWSGDETDWRGPATLVLRI